MGNREEKRAKRRERRKAKPSLRQRMTAHVNESVDLGRVLVREPRSFPSVLASLFRRSFRKVWNARGGGLYACGFFVSLVWLEIQTVVAEFGGSDSISGFFRGQLIQFLLRFTVDSLINTVYALAWPVLLVSYSPPMGLVILGMLYAVFLYVLKKPLERWLFHDSDLPGTAQSEAVAKREE